MKNLLIILIFLNNCIKNINELSFLHKNINNDLIEACKIDNDEIASFLLEKGANINYKDHLGKTGLMYAAENGNIKIVKMLVIKKAFINEKSDLKITALTYAVENGHADIVITLLENGALINDYSNSYEKELIIACHKGYLNIVDILTNKCFDVNFIGGRKKTPLMYAAENGYLDIVTLLINKGACINSKDEKEKTPLIYAVKKGYLKIVTKLLMSRTNIYHQDEKGNTALMYASKKGYRKIVELLIKTAYYDEAIYNRLYIDVENKKRKTALMYAAENGHVEIIKLLQENGADINYYSYYPSDSYFRNHTYTRLHYNYKSYGISPLMHASKNGHKEVVELLLNNSNNANNKDYSGRTALIYLCNELKNKKMEYKVKDRYLETSYLLIKAMKGDYISLFININKKLDNYKTTKNSIKKIFNKLVLSKSKLQSRSYKKNRIKIAKNRIKDYIDLLHYLQFLPPEILIKIIENI